MSTAPAVPAAPVVSPADIEPGMWLRVHRYGYSRPTVGVVRRSRSVLLADSDALYLDSDPGAIVRSPNGQMATEVKALEVLTADSVMTTDERFDLLASLMRRFASLLAERPDAASLGQADELATLIADAKSEIIGLVRGAW